MKQAAIVSENLSRSFNGRQAVNNVCLNIKYGEIFGIVGPDGAGKSTLLRMLSTILPPDSGHALVCGFDSVKEDEKVKTRIAYMSQKFGLYPDLTVEENIRFYADLYCVPVSETEKNIDHLLRFSYMHPFRKRLAEKLSGGMKQKLQLICALVHTPEILILDEPTNGVDPVSRRDFWRMLENLSAKGVTLIVSTSYLDEAERCHRIALMHEGQIFTEGTPEEISIESQLKINIWQGNHAESAFADLTRDGNIKGLRLFGDSIRFCYSSEQELKTLKTKGSQTAFDSLSEIKDARPGLEDIFVNYLEKSHQTSNSDYFFPLAAPSAKEFSVKIENLHKSFGDFTAVNSLNLEVKQGEIFGFLGPNGAGKSTTIRMLCGLLKPTSGLGYVAGLDLFKNAEDIKKKIGYMSQKFSLYSELTVLENITFYGGIYGLSGKELKEKADWALRLSGLSKQSSSQVAILSLGFKQRLALACALLHDPPIVFLDEPTSGVDPLTRRQFWNTIEKLAKNGRTVFVTTHYMEEAEYCDRIAFINSGRLMACGSPASLKNDFTGYQIIHIDVPAAADRLKNLLSIEGIKDAYTYGHGYRLLLDQSCNPALVLSSLESHYYNGSFKVLKPSMEDVFVHLSASHFSEFNSMEFKA